MPLIEAGTEPMDTPVSEAHARARKINPAYTEGELVRVSGGQNQPEAELIQGLLLEEGIPSVLRRTAGFDVPDFLAAGPRDVLVPQAGEEAAREALLSAGLPPAGPPLPGPPAAKLIGVILAVGAAGAFVLWLLLQVPR